MLVKQLLVFLLLWISGPLLAQNISIEVGPANLPIDQYFTVAVRVEGGEVKIQDPFPEIVGFKKSSRFATTTTTTVAGKATVSKSVTQRYAALEEGKFVLKPFSMKVNGQMVASRGLTITVGPMRQEGVAQEEEESEENGEAEEESREYLERVDDAFLSLSTSKKEVYVGEGVQISLWFYLLSTDQHLHQFHDFANQIPVLIRQLRQKHAWEESIDQIGEVLPEEVTIEGRQYLRYRLHSAVYFPLNAETMTFPSVELKMLRYKAGPESAYSPENRQGEIRTHISRVKQVAVRELPPHPLRQMVPVGEYRLRERLSRATVAAGKGFDYVFQVEGEGNLAAVTAPQLAPFAGMEIFPPEVTQEVTRQRRGIQGQKAFRYHLLPQEPGKIDLGNFFSLIYFNPAIGQYDTLRSAQSVVVTGEGDANAAIQSQDLGPFYNLIHTEDNILESLDKVDQIKRYTNMIVLLLFAIALFMLFKR